MLGWCAIISYDVLLLWFLVFRLVQDWIYRLQASMAIYKIGVLLFTLVPYVALLVIGRRVRK